MWASFDFLMSGLLLVGARWRDEKGGHQGSWMEPRFFFLVWRCGGIHPSQLPTPRLGGWQGTILHSPHHDTPISAHTAEDALEGVYFAFSSILRCLPYFSQSRRPVSSYELLEALLPSCGRCGVTAGVWRAPSSTRHTPTPPSHHTSLRMP